MNTLADTSLMNLTSFSLRGTTRFALLQIVIAGMTNLLSLALPIMMLQVYDRIIPHQAYGTLVVLASGVLVALALDAILRVIRSWLTGWITSTQEHAAGCAAVQRFCHADINAFSETDTGTHLQNMNALGRLREFYSGQALTALIDLPFVVLFLGLIAYLGRELVVVPLVLLILFLVMAVSFGRNLRDSLERRAVEDNYKSSYLVAILNGIHTVKSFAMEMFALRGFDRHQRRIAHESYGVALASGQSMLLGAAFGQLSLILTATAGVWLVLQNDLSVGGLSACTLLAGRTIQPVQRVLGTWLRLQDMSVAKQQASQLFVMPDRSFAHHDLANLRGDIAFDRISFSYDDGTRVLSQVTLDIPAGEVVALSGEKGSGKSTLLQMVAGLHMPAGGQVLLDGNINPASCPPSLLARSVGYLPQRAVIFKGSILDNLTGFRNDPMTTQAAQNAARELGLDVVINALPRGYQTQLIDSPADPIPPGVKQRIGLARVMLFKPKILLFDDADRALDKEGYNRLFRLMGRLKGKCTMMIVSEDQNLLSFADRFYHLENGILSADAIKPSQHLVFLTQQDKV